MYRKQHKGIPFPKAIPTPITVYRGAFRRFPVWYRWYIRLRSLFSSQTIESTTKNHHLHQLRRRIAITAKTAVDPTVPALIGGFHSAIREIQDQLRRIDPSLDEATGTARGSFLRLVLAERNPRLHAAIQEAMHLTDSERDDPQITLERVQQAMQQRIEDRIEANRKQIAAILEPIWKSLRSLNVLGRVDIEALLPVQGARRPETPLRVVKDPLLALYQAAELCHRNQSDDATELALSFARPRIRGTATSSKHVWLAINSLWKQTPLIDLCRFATDDPFLEVPTIVLKTDWWGPFVRSWIETGLNRCGNELLEHRHGQLLRFVGEVFHVEANPPGWIPSVLHPHTLGSLVLLAESGLFHDTRRAITQIVIDATFYHLDTRNTLHHMALQIDQSLEEITRRIGDSDHRGSLGEEVIRLQNRSGPSSIIHRQLTTVYERHRPQLRTATERCIESLRTAGTIMERNILGTEEEFEFNDLQGAGFTSDHSLTDLVRIVAHRWRYLGEILAGLYSLETTLSQLPRGRRGNRY